MNENRAEILASATKTLRNHLQYRKLWHLDTEDPSWEANELLKKQLFIKGCLCSDADTENRLLWFTEYRGFKPEVRRRKKFARSVLQLVQPLYKTSDYMRLHFLIHEHVLRAVNVHVCCSVYDRSYALTIAQERATGRLSSTHQIIDLTGFEIGTATLQMFYSGMIAYLTQTIQYEHYPELIILMQFVNSSQWIAPPYKVDYLIFYRELHSYLAAPLLGVAGQLYRAHPHS